MTRKKTSRIPNKKTIKAIKEANDPAKYKTLKKIDDLDDLLKKLK